MVLSVCGDGKSYTLFLETDPSEDDPKPRQYFTRFPTRLGYSRVSDVPSNSQCQLRHAQKSSRTSYAFGDRMYLVLNVSFTKMVPNIVEYVWIT